MRGASAQPVTSAAGERSLVRAAARGDVRAFAELIDPRLERAFRLACAVLGSDADAADAAHHAFIAAWRELPRLADHRQFDAWFDRILIGECRMQARQRPRSAVDRVAGAAARARAEAAGGLPLVDDASVLDILEDRFGELDPDDRTILVLQYLDGLPTGEIGDALHLPADSIERRSREARWTLATELGPW